MREVRQMLDKQGILRERVVRVEPGAGKKEKVDPYRRMGDSHRIGSEDGSLGGLTERGGVSPVKTGASFMD